MGKCFASIVRTESDKSFFHEPLAQGAIVPTSPKKFNQCKMNPAAAIDCPIFLTDKGDCVRCDKLTETPGTVARFPGNIHASENPGFIVDSHGEKVSTVPNNIMAVVDSKMTEPITISRGMAWLVGVALAVVPVGIMLIAYMISGAMGYQTVVSRMAEAEKRLDKLEKVSDDVQRLTLTTENVKNDVSNIRATQTSSEVERKEMSKNIADIRILLATKSMNAQQ